MFSRWGRFLYRRRRPVFVLAIVFGIAVGSFAGKAASELSAGGWLDPGSESNAVATRLAEDFGAGKGALVLVYRGPGGGDATSPAFQAAIARSVQGLGGSGLVDQIIGYGQTGDRRFISTDGGSAYVVVQLNVSDEASVDHLDELEAGIAQPGDGIQLLLGGYGPLTRDSAHQSEQDLIRAETVSLPIAAVILILVFGSLVAAGLPLLVAGLAIPTTLGAVYFVAQATELSIYVQNVSTMLGLALAIDYSLFMVSRFREELRRGRDVATAVEITTATSGKAVAFSGLAVAVGLSGLLLFEPAALRSFGIGGALTVAASVLYALTFLPAVLGMLGPRVNAGGTAALRDRVRRLFGRPVGVAADVARESRWERMAHWVMARPVAVLIPTLALLLLMGVPYLRLEQGIPAASILPAGIESREAAVALSRAFRAGETSPIIVLADVEGSPTDEANVQRVLDLSAAIS